MYIFTYQLFVTMDSDLLCRIFWLVVFVYSAIIFSRCIHYHFARMMNSKMKHCVEKKHVRTYFGNEMRAKFKNEIFTFFLNSTCNLSFYCREHYKYFVSIFNISFSMKCYIPCETRYSKLQFPHPRWYVHPTYHGINESLFVLCFHRRSNSSGWTRIRYTWCTIPYIGKLNRSLLSWEHPAYSWVQEQV